MELEDEFEKLVESPVFDDSACLKILENIDKEYLLLLLINSQLQNNSELSKEETDRLNLESDKETHDYEYCVLKQQLNTKGFSIIKAVCKFGVIYITVKSAKGRIYRFRFIQKGGIIMDDYDVTSDYSDDETTDTGTVDSGLGDSGLGDSGSCDRFDDIETDVNSEGNNESDSELVDSKENESDTELVDNTENELVVNTENEFDKDTQDKSSELIASDKNPQEQADKSEKDDLNDIEQVSDEVPEEVRAEINEKSSYSPEVNSYINSVEELEIYQNDCLKEIEVNGKICLIRSDIDMNQQVDDFGLTNADLIKEGYAPFDTNGRKIELHHIGQKDDAPLAELKFEEHRSSKTYSILHDSNKESEINRGHFDVEREAHWLSRAQADTKENE